MASGPSSPSPARGTKRCHSDGNTAEPPVTPGTSEPGAVPSPRPISIVLTGGPCSGKSSVMALIRDRLSKRGMQVVVVPEYATHFFANSDGFQVEWVGTQKEEDLQHVFLNYQTMQEDMFRQFAALNSKTSVLLLDRGALDQKVFTSDVKIWEGALRRSNVTEQQLLERYDMIMHLGTCAKVGDYEWGPESNNPGRYHCPDEASRLDAVCEEVYKNHKQLRKVPHCKLFEDKVEVVMQYLQDALQVDGLTGKRQRIAVQLSTSTVPQEVQEQAQAFVITSTFLDENLQRSLRRRVRVAAEHWHRGLSGDLSPIEAALAKDSPEMRGAMFEEREAIPEESYLARRVVSPTEYRHLAALARRPPVDRCVLSFQDACGSHYELFYFRSTAGGELVLDLSVGAALPRWLAARPEAAAVPHPAAAGKDLPAEPLKGRLRRSLGRHTTEEAAHAQFGLPAALS